jgi:hypothetical protein
MLLRESPTGAITNGNAPGDALTWNGLEWLPAPGGGGAGFTFPGRADCSVNSGRVDGANSDAPILRTLTAAPLAGGYNGGGTGSKSILGIDAGHLLPLGALASFAWTSKNLMPYNPAPWPLGYVNFLLDVNGNGTLWKVLVVDPQSPPALLAGVQTPHLDGSVTVSWTQAANLVLIVNDLPPVVPTVSLGPTWPNHGYTLASILASYPAARLSRANTLDGGLPKAQTLPPFLVINGDSTSNRTIATRVPSVVLNGIQV